jgi:hypothetical protein
LFIDSLQGCQAGVFPNFYVYGFTCMSGFMRQVQHVCIGIRDTYAERT